MMSAALIGTVIRTWVNDVPVTYMVDDLTMNGIIALQVHSVKEREGGAQIAWKNIRIQTGKDMKPRPLDNTTPVANYTLNTLSPQEVAQGFSLLFNGKNLEGWKMVGEDAPPTSGWVVNDGVLSILATDTASKVKHGDLLTAKTFTSYELNFDFKPNQLADLKDVSNKVVLGIAHDMYPYELTMKDSFRENLIRYLN